MNKKTTPYLLVAITILATGIVGSASAHLMVAQRGTLNFTHKGVYMVLSLPASAFINADDNNDAHMQSSEFITHRLSIIETIKNDVVIRNDKVAHTIEGMMLTPVPKDYAEHSHDDETVGKKTTESDTKIIDQIIVMGRFPLTYSDENSLSFKTSLLGQSKEERLLTVTAKMADKSKTHEFGISPKLQEVRLFEKQ